ncbi:MAG: aldo/keto reductase, partial [Acidobacteriaceae bacterium]|nr:aldo/keto reductase [Acidobacteriaceae bacterium]
MDRRQALNAIAGAGLTAMARAQSAQEQTTDQANPNGMIYRQLGTTGQRVSAIGLGGYHISVPKDDQEATRIVRSALDRGITFRDNCWDYADGVSETRMGKALQDGYRQKAFLMT